LRLRKSVKVLPGIKVNLGLKSSSVTIGGKGASVNFSKRGTYLNSSIPGTRISSRQKISESKLSKEEKLQEQKNKLNKTNLELNDDGSILYKNIDGIELTRSDINLIWKLKKDEINNWLLKEKDDINDMNLITSIHLDSPNPNLKPLLDIKEFEIDFPNKPKKRIIKKPFFLFLLIKPIKIKYEKELNEIENEYKIKLNSWKNEVSIWEKSKEDFEKKQIANKEKFDRMIQNDENTMTNYLEKVYHNLEWPRETIISYELNISKQTIYIDIDLPEIEDIPNKIAVLSASGKKLNIKNKTLKQLRLEYASHIHAIAFRIASYTFASLPSVNRIILSGYSQRLDKSIGKINDEYLFSIKIDRNIISKVNYENLNNLDLIEFFNNYKFIRNMTSTGIFKKIEPYSFE